MFPKDHSISAGGTINVGGVNKAGKCIKLSPRATEFALAERFRSCQRDEAITRVVILLV